jgi:phosphatidylethanolamine/phosphatidyl-N-methylethanolamine N-methyltransferase
MPAFKFSNPQQAYDAAARELETLHATQVSLDFSFFGLLHLPPAIGRLTELRHLDLSSNRLCELPSEIGQLVHLETLDLSSSGLTVWPWPIERLTSTEIDLRGNGIFPPAIEAAFRRGRINDVRDDQIVKTIRDEIHLLRESGVRLDDEVRSIQSWIDSRSRLDIAMPFGDALARAMARHIDVYSAAPVVELAPGTGRITDALIDRGVDQKRLVLVEFDPALCALLRKRYPRARVVQGDAYDLRASLRNVLGAPACAVVSSLPLVTKPMMTRAKLLRDAFALLEPGAPFVQSTYAAAAPIPKSMPGVFASSSERIWTNVPPARVWFYREKPDFHNAVRMADQRRQRGFSPPGDDELRPQPEQFAVPALPAGKEERVAAPDDFRVHLRDLYQALQQEPVLDGLDHPGVAILIEAFEDDPDVAARWMLNQLADPAGPAMVSDILRLLCRFKPQTSAWRRNVVAAALRSTSVELRDAAIQAVESWGDPELVALLSAHADVAPWLDDYATQVVKDLAG